jgi:50S ribosomal protein L16 3-hydroxylase
MEDGVDARIVSCDDGHWQQRRGPFRSEEFQRSGAWSLLVQSVDHYWDEALQLMTAVDFLPSWRLDDVMMSYATDQGSAGPHFDNYDVFIIQGEGQRRWRIGGFCDASSATIPNTDMRLLAEFETQHEYLMRQGDVLYIPPGCAHWGISVGESTSFSIGFRAPRLSDLLARWIDNRLASIEDDWLLRDPRREPARRAGEISEHDVLRARTQLAALLEDDDIRWFGEAVTMRPHSPGPESGQDALASRSMQASLIRSPHSAIAWQLREGELWVFSQGQSRGFPAGLRPLVQALCSQEIVDVDQAMTQHDSAQALIAWLLEEGCVELC